MHLQEGTGVGRARSSGGHKLAVGYFKCSKFPSFHQVMDEIGSQTFPEIGRGLYVEEFPEC